VADVDFVIPLDKVMDVHEELAVVVENQAKPYFLLLKRNDTTINNVQAGNTERGGSITVLLTSCVTGLDESVLQIKTKTVSCHTADSKPVRQEVNSTVILPLLVFPGL
jgi:hypothetical protein